MCRSIKVLRERDIPASDDEIAAAALQYVRKISGYRDVRKISGYRAPSRANEMAFNAAVDEITLASKRLLGSLKYGARA